MIARLPRRDLFAILGALTATTLLCWWYLWDMAAGMQGMMEMPGKEMPGMEMPGMEMPGMEMPGMEMSGMGIPVWDATYALAMFAMWAIMMVGMMLPSVAPTTLIYAGIVRKAREDGHVVASTGWFAAGYLLAWTGFSVLATALQWQLDRAALLSPMMASNSPRFGAALLLAAGIYQFLPVKNACLSHCRSPAHFLAQHWRRGTLGALRMGLHHGSYCLGCCWVLMGLLFLGGVMNLLWIAAITGFVLLEKLIDTGPWTSRLAGFAMLLVGGWLLVA